MDLFVLIVTAIFMILLFTLTRTYDKERKRLIDGLKYYESGNYDAGLTARMILDELPERRRERERRG